MGAPGDLIFEPRGHGARTGMQATSLPDCWRSAPRQVSSSTLPSSSSWAAPRGLHRRTWPPSERDTASRSSHRALPGHVERFGWRFPASRSDRRIRGDRYEWLLFLHITSGFAFFAAYTIVSVVLVAGRRTASTATVRALLRLARPAEALAWVGATGTLVFGNWLAVDLDAYQLWDGWIVGAIALSHVAGRRPTGEAGLRDLQVRDAWPTPREDQVAERTTSSRRIRVTGNQWRPLPGSSRSWEQVRRRRRSPNRSRTEDRRMSEELALRQPVLATPWVSRLCLVGGCGRAPRQDPVRPREVARVAVRIALEVVLMLGLGLPERAGRRNLGHDLPGPDARSLDVGDRVLRDAALLVVERSRSPSGSSCRCRCPDGSASSGRGSGRRTRGCRGTRSAPDRRRSRSPPRACRGCGTSRSGRRRPSSRPASTRRRAASGSGPASPRSTRRRGSPSRSQCSRYRRLGGVAHRLQLEPVGIEPVGREAVLPVLGELLRLVEDDRVVLARPPVRVPDDRPARDQEREVMETGLAARIGVPAPLGRRTTASRARRRARS